MIQVRTSNKPRSKITKSRFKSDCHKGGHFCYNLLVKKDTFYARDRKTWRSWLLQNHESSTGIWLIYDKKSVDKRALSGDDISEEAICFGWIDSVPKSLSATQAMLYVSPRKPKSNWSRLNRERSEKMIMAGKMNKSGLSVIALAKKTGTWKALEDAQNSVVPPDLKKEFKGSKKGWVNFMAFPPSSKRIILEWILNAKQAETRKKRITETVRLAAKGIKANHYRQ